MLEIKNLQVLIEGKLILKGVDLEIKPGEVHVVMGPNGGGKSTLAQTLMGHPLYKLKTQNLKLKINGEDIVDMSPDERARKGLFLAFQYPVSVSGVSVQNFLWRAFQALNIKNKIGILEFRKIMENKAKELGIKKELLKRSLNDGFSGGEKKRVEILQLLLLKPKYVLLDEIDSGLDVDAIKLVANGVEKALSDFSPGVLLITHYKRILEFLKPDFVHVMVDGRIVKSGKYDLVDEIEKSGYKNIK